VLPVSEESQKCEDVKICIEHLDFSYSGDQRRESKVIADLSLSLRDQEFLTIVGASGCGKSTLLNIIAGLIPPSAGTVLLDGKAIREPGPDRTMVFQDDAVFPWYTVQENVAYGLKISGTGKKEVEKQVGYYLDLVGLSECADYYPRQLSGGMKKRVDVARAIITKPEVLLMDEPFAALDVMTKQRLQEQFLNIWNETRMTVIFVTHDLEEAIFLADRVAVMASHPGRIVRIVDVPFARPREKDLKTSGEFQNLRRKLSHIIDANQAETV
jgi:ABC-type nitrate/sulfonate/bicarbonate transport system ATPase subunit